VVELAGSYRGNGIVRTWIFVWTRAFQSINNGKRLAHIAGALVLILGVLFL